MLEYHTQVGRKFMSIRTPNDSLPQRSHTALKDSSKLASELVNPTLIAYAGIKKRVCGIPIAISITLSAITTNTGFLHRLRSNKFEKHEQIEEAIVWRGSESSRVILGFSISLLSSTSATNSVDPISETLLHEPFERLQVDECLDTSKYGSFSLSE
jgi:hypothetical protein